jgi:hypothetical protein
MEKIVFRTLKAEEIELRVGQIKKDGCSLLLYQDSRVAMTLLDEVVGTMNWCREHNFKDGKLYCKVGIWDDSKNQFVYKEDVGVESNTEAEKGQASDSFKRASVNWGIGRELYTAPFTWVKLNDGETYEKNGRTQLSPSIKFSVKTIEYDSNRTISKLVIVDNKGIERFTFGVKSVSKPKTEKPKKVEPVQPSVDVNVEVDPLPYIEPTPIESQLTREELSLIANDKDLTEVMLDCLGGLKYKDLSDEGKLVIAKQLRHKMKEMGL